MAANHTSPNHACSNRQLTTNGCRHRRPLHGARCRPQHMHQEDCPNYNQSRYDEHNHTTRISEQPTAVNGNLAVALPHTHMFSAGAAPVPHVGQYNTALSTNPTFCQVHGALALQQEQLVDGAPGCHAHNNTIPTNAASSQQHSGVVRQQEQSMATDHSMNNITPIDNLAGFSYQDEDKDDEGSLFPKTFGAYSSPGSIFRDDMVIALSKEDRNRPLFYVETHSVFSASGEPSIVLRSSPNYAEIGTADLPFLSRKTHIEAFGKLKRYSIIMQKGNPFSRRSTLQIPIETRGTIEEFEWKGFGGELIQTNTGRVVARWNFRGAWGIWSCHRGDMTFVGKGDQDPRIEFGRAWESAVVMSFLALLLLRIRAGRNNHS